MSNFELIGIVGAGQMGRGIALACLKSKHRVILIDADAEMLVSAHHLIEQKLHEENEQINLSHLSLAKNLVDLKDANLVIEAIREDLETKITLFKQIEPLVSHDAVLATNTSAISLSELRQALKNPKRFLGIHFMNPVWRMNLVEIIWHAHTEPSTIKVAEEFVKSLGKISVLVQDCPGFIVNRLLFSLIATALELGLSRKASFADIDIAMQMGANHPLGPFALADLIGLDVCKPILDELNLTTPQMDELLNKMLNSNHMGRKTQKGFYDYSTKPAKPIEWL